MTTWLTLYQWQITQHEANGRLSELWLSYKIFMNVDLRFIPRLVRLTDD